MRFRTPGRRSTRRRAAHANRAPAPWPRFSTVAHCRLLALEDASCVVGTAILMILPNLSAGGRLQAIVENVVDERRRGRGYSARLMAYCLAEATATGCITLQLDSSVRRTDAHRFDERPGFVFTHRGYTFPLA
ncbi:MAG TPA: GNAT family N-acetyltransferase [Dehalococcoidia bacterium]|jgi:GNAT superfamily N-acetyltransferase